MVDEGSVVRLWEYVMSSNGGRGDEDLPLGALDCLVIRSIVSRRDGTSTASKVGRLPRLCCGLPNPAWLASGRALESTEAASEREERGA